MNKELEEAIQVCREIIQQNNEIVKQARKNNDINAMQLTANCDNESKAIETLIKAVENSIPKSVVEEAIAEMERMSKLAEECIEEK